MATLSNTVKAYVHYFEILWMHSLLLDTNNEIVQYSYRIIANKCTPMPLGYGSLRGFHQWFRIGNQNVFDRDTAFFFNPNTFYINGHNSVKNSLISIGNTVGKLRTCSKASEPLPSEFHKRTVCLAMKTPTCHTSCESMG